MPAPIPARRTTWLRCATLAGSLLVGIALGLPSIALAGFGPAVDLSTPGVTAQQPQVATGADGTTVVVWGRASGGNGIEAVTRPPGAATFGAPVDVSGVVPAAWSPQVAVGPDGTTTVTWFGTDGTNDLIWVATRPAGATAFGSPVSLSATGQNADAPQIAVGPDGTTTIT